MIKEIKKELNNHIEEFKNGIWLFTLKIEKIKEEEKSRDKYEIYIKNTKEFFALLIKEDILSDIELANCIEEDLLFNYDILDVTEKKY